ncbi:MAG TPA: helix-turn-helix transcriptional regulator [Clostridiales bacterium]|nr:helix-turn-helix transcriptional regulator [Clostridiales bacterium]
MSSVSELKELFIEMGNAYLSLIVEKQQAVYGHPLDKCIHFINQQLYSNLTAHQVAEHMHMNLTYLTTLFKEKTSYSLYEYIQFRKIEEAKQMLKHTSASVTDIAYALGYSSTPHFSKAFKNFVGKTPQKYRIEN